jgi:acetyl-CoA synthetase
VSAAHGDRHESIVPLVKPRDNMVVAKVPKTRSGKIMRRRLRDVAENRPVDDVTTLADSTEMDPAIRGLAAGHGRLTFCWSG